MIFRTENWIIMFLCFSFVMFGIFTWHTSLLTKQTQENIKTEDTLIESNRAALAQVDAKASTGAVFASEDARKAAVAKFKDNFAKAMNYSGNNYSLVDYYIPCIFLVDDEGYYVAYTSSTIDNGAEYVTNVITGLNTWTRTYGDYTIRYHLSDTVEVFKGNEQLSASYTKAYNYFSNPSELSFMADADSFYEEKNNVICTITEDQINYYITTHNNYANKHDRAYTFTMPKMTDFNVRLMDKPSVISFAQGMQYSTTKGYINVYALTGAIEDEENMYYEVKYNSNLYYHTSDCPKVNTDTVEPKTAKDCAKEGYSPCPYCVK